MKKQSGHEKTQKEREGICQLQQTQSSCTLTHTASHDKLHQRGGGGREGGRRHCTESTSTTMDGRTPKTHTHTHTHTTAQGPSLRSTALSWLPEPRCVFSRKNNKRTD